MRNRNEEAIAQGDEHVRSHTVRARFSCLNLFGAYAWQVRTKVIPRRQHCTLVRFRAESDGESGSYAV